MHNDRTFRVTDTQDGRYAVEDERGFVLEGLTRTQAKRLKAYLLKLRAEAARPETAKPINGERLHGGVRVPDKGLPKADGTPKRAGY
jgi:hypothetical protein